MKALNLIKIGGSVITNKEEECSFRRAAAAQIAKNVPPRTIVVHGSGAYGKPPAIKHGYLDGIIQPERISHILYVRLRLATLNTLFVDMLLNNSVPAFGVSASLLFTHNRGRLSYRGDDLITDCIKRNIVPVIYSDFIIYRGGSLRVLSSDEITFAMARRYKPRHTIFATDVDGVLKREGDTPQKRPEIFQYLYAGNKDAVIKDVGRSTLDVTGGMYEKIRFALRAAEHSRHCIILNGHKGGRIKSFCAGEKVVGTRIGTRRPESKGGNGLLKKSAQGPVRRAGEKTNAKPRL